MIATTSGSTGSECRQSRRSCGPITASRNASYSHCSIRLILARNSHPSERPRARADQPDAEGEPGEQRQDAGVRRPHALEHADVLPLVADDHVEDDEDDEDRRDPDQDEHQAQQDLLLLHGSDDRPAIPLPVLHGHRVQKIAVGRIRPCPAGTGATGPPTWRVPSSTPTSGRNLM